MPVHIWFGVLSKDRLASTPNYTFGENLVLRIFQKFILTAVFAVLHRKPLRFLFRPIGLIQRNQEWAPFVMHIHTTTR